MWKKYKRRVLLAMSSLAFAQLASNSLIDIHIHLTDRLLYLEWDKWYLPHFKLSFFAKVMLFTLVISYYARKSFFIKERTAQSDYISYTARVFEEAGWIGRQAILMTGINSVIYVLSTVPTCVFSFELQGFFI